MSGPTRTTAILGAATAVALATAGWLTAGSAFADDIPAPEPTVEPTSVAEPTSSPTPVGEPTGQPSSTPTPTPGDPTNSTGDGAPALPVAPGVADGAADTAAAATTSGNSFGSAVVISGLWPSVQFDSQAATVQSGEPRKLYDGGYMQRTMWAKWKAPASGFVTVNANALSGTGNTAIQVFTGTSLTHLKEIAYNDQQYHPIPGAAGVGTFPDLRATIMSLPVTSQKTYYIQVGSSTNDPSSTPSVSGFPLLTLTVIPNRYTPKNDSLGAATELKFSAGSGAVKLFTPLLNGSTIETWEPTDNDESAGVTRVGSVWYKFTAPQTGLLTVDTCQNGENPTVAVFSSGAATGAGWGDLFMNAFDYNDNANCGDAGAGDGGSVTVVGTRGRTYFVQVAHTGSNIPKSAEASLSMQFTQPYIDKLSKTSGKSGTVLTITGQAFLVGGTPVVKFGSKTATILDLTGSSIKVKVPSQGGHKGKVSVTVTNTSPSPDVVSNKVSFTYK